MGLRAKLGLILTLFFALLALGTAGFIQSRLESHYNDIERRDATHAMERVLRGIESEIAGLERTTGEWSNWTALHRYMQQPDPAFAAEYLSRDAVSAFQLSVLQLRDGQGQTMALIELPDAQGNTPAERFIRTESSTYQQYLRRFTSTTPALCGMGLLSPSSPPVMLCDNPVLTRAREGAGVGRIFMARTLDAAAIERIKRLTHQHFRLVLSNAGLPPFEGDEGLPVAGLSLAGIERPGHLAQTAEMITVAFPIYGFVSDRRLGWLYLDYPREQYARVKQQAFSLIQSVLFLLAITAVLVTIAVDWLVVRRLLRLRREVDALPNTPGWTGRVSEGGEDELDTLTQHINALLGVMSTQVQQLRDLSHSDTLTGLANQRHFEQRLSIALARIRREKAPLSLLLIDVDHYRQFNELYGSDVGDAALRQIADALRSAIRRGTDLAARIEKDDFALLLEDTDLAGAQARAASAIDDIRKKNIAHVGVEGSVLTISIGVVEAGPMDDADVLYQRAERQLYQAKQTGRDRFVAQA
jgi:diguanylate cyclase (GGDEF)-like protein